MSSNLPERISNYADALQIDHSIALEAVVNQINKDLQLTGIDYMLEAEDTQSLQLRLDHMLLQLQRGSLELLSNFLYRADVAPDKVPMFLDSSEETIGRASMELVKRVLERVRFRLEYQSKPEQE